jgi:hypothetical protein
MLTELKSIQLPPLPQDKLSLFRLDTMAGRDELAQQIEADIDTWCQLQYDDGPRSHLGASIIGHECERFIWFSFRWMYYQVFSGRMQRLFQRGHLEEYRIFQWLQGIGFRTTSVDLDGKQIRILFAEGHGGGSTDGVAMLPTRYGNFTEPILLEMKTQKDKKFAALQGSGVEKEKPLHFIQASVYGRRLGIRYCLYIAVNKETDDLDVELIELDWGKADAELLKAETIIDAPFPPRRISENASQYQCKYCPAVGVCHLGAPVMKNCRSCFYAKAVAGKQWHCNRWNAIIPPDAIPKGCDGWQQLPTR